MLGAVEQDAKANVERRAGSLIGQRDGKDEIPSFRRRITTLVGDDDRLCAVPFAALHEYALPGGYGGRECGGDRGDHGYDKCEGLTAGGGNERRRNHGSVLSLERRRRECCPRGAWHSNAIELPARPQRLDLPVPGLRPTS